MKTLALEDGDLAFVNGDFVIIDGAEEVAQCIEIDLGTNRGEWFLNLLRGTDFELILDKSTDAQARAEIFRVLGNEERIDTINELEIQSDTKKRERTIYFDVTLTNGENVKREVRIGA